MTVDLRNLDFTEKQLLVLETMSGNIVQTIGHAINTHADIYYNEVSRLSFDIPAEIDGAELAEYSAAVGMMVVHWVGVGRFLIVSSDVSSDDGKKMRHCDCCSLEYELNRKIVTFPEGTYRLHDPLSKNDSILGFVLEVFPEWSIGNIDDSLYGVYRTFDAESENAYSLLKNRVQKSFQCVFDFDTVNRKINVIDANRSLEPVPVYIGSGRLQKKIVVSENTEDIVTCLDVNGEEGVDIRDVTPTGENRIYNLDYFMNETHFSPSMIQKWSMWKAHYESIQQSCFDLHTQYAAESMRAATENAALTELKHELKSLENRQAVIVQAIQQRLMEQSDLEQINQQIQDKNAEIGRKNSEIENIGGRIQGIMRSIVDMKNSSSFSAYFSDEEIDLLRPYFIESVISESTFAAPKSQTYTNSLISNTISGNTLHMAGELISHTQNSENGMQIVSYGRGACTIGSSDQDMLSSDFARASVVATPDESGGYDVTVSVYLKDGIFRTVSFSNGTFSISGSANELSVTTNDDGITDTDIVILSASTYLSYDTTDYEKQSIAWDLYEYGKTVLAKRSSPAYTFSVDCENFLALEDFTDFKNNLKLGRTVYIEADGDVLTPYVVKLSVALDDIRSLSIDFSNKYSANDSSFSLTDLLDQSVSMGRELDVKGATYSEFKTSGANNAVLNFMRSSLDVAKNAVTSSGSQAIEFGDAGIRVRQWADQNDHSQGYDDNQIWIVNNCMAFTDDGWSTAKIAIGEIFDENFGNDVVRYQRTHDTNRIDGKQYYTDIHGTPWDGSAEWSASLYEKILGGLQYGIAAPYIVGTMLAGQNLVITNGEGSFRVDGSGVHIDQSNLYITHAGSSGNTESRSIGEVLEVTEHGAKLKAGTIAGAIASSTLGSGSGSGNVVFNGDGMWLINTADFNTATKAVKLNEHGVMFGVGTAGHIFDSVESTKWDWKTGIDASGVYATGVVEGTTVKGINLIGGSLNIGPKGTEPETYHFSVDEEGNLYAENGTFSGVIKGASFQTANGASMLTGDGKFKGEYLDVTAANISGTLTVGQLPSNVAFSGDSISIFNNDSGYQTGAGVTTIIGDVVNTGFINARNVTAYTIQANSLIQSPDIVGAEYYSSSKIGKLVLDEKTDTGNDFPSMVYSNERLGTSREVFRVDDLYTGDTVMFRAQGCDMMMHVLGSVYGDSSLFILTDSVSLPNVYMTPGSYGTADPRYNPMTSDETTDGRLYFQIVG